MTNNDHDAPPPLTPAATGAAPAATRKKAARKAPVNPAASKTVAASKATAKKSAAKKTARKVVAKVAAAASGSAVAVASSRSDFSPELPLVFSPSPAPARQVTAASDGRDATAATSDNSAQVPTQVPTPKATPKATPRRIGRVPGGGAVNLREPSKVPRATRKTKTPAAPQASTEIPQSPAAPAAPQVAAAEPAPAPPPLEATAAPVPAAAPAPPQPTPTPYPYSAPNGENRSKRRREKRKKQHNQGQHRYQGQHRQQPHTADPNSNPNSNSNSNPNPNRPDPEANRQPPLTGPKLATNGMLELAPKGFGFLRVPEKNFEQARDDVFVPPELIRRHNLRIGQWLHGLYQEGSRGPQLVEITQLNGLPPEEVAKFPHFDELKAINPTKRLSFETTPDRFTTRVIDIMTPVGRGQRGLIVSPPRSGKTTMLLHTAEAVRDKYSDSLHLMILLIDERPEEVTEFRRALPGVEIYASSNDEVARNHCRIAELAIERAKRLVEAGKDVFLLMDSITRLARAYNATMNNVGRGTGSGGITIGALEVPRRLFAAARNTRGGGSLTILATALIQTNSRADEAIFLEFKGTGNMELVLDRKIAENYIYPAVDIFKSGTRREELLLPEHMLHKIHLIRRGLAGHRPVEAMERLLFFLKKFSNNPQMLLEIKG
ncbi:MAG: transcription termination factor Rho [Verrucomicrobia bacterium]|nr:transcription termination factor Rho [Verrucomicrobiota bacterium]